MPFIRRLIFWEAHFKRLILDKYAAKCPRLTEHVGLKRFTIAIKITQPHKIVGRYINSVTEEVRASHKWWNPDFTADDDSINCLPQQEYSLTD